MNSARESAKVLIKAVKKDIKPRDLVARKSIENAVAVIMVMGGSTNAVLHFLAIAHAAGVEWTIDDFERVRQKTPVLCNLKPSGQYLAVDLHLAGGIPQVMKTLLVAGLLRGDCVTISGAGRAGAGTSRLGLLGCQLPRRTFGRTAAARRPGAGAGLRPVDPADGRGVLGAGPDHPQRNAVRTAAPAGA